jgi:hypothetical protein
MTTDRNQVSATGPGGLGVLALAWLSVSIPLAWGVAQTIKKALALFS